MLANFVGRSALATVVALAGFAGSATVREVPVRAPHAPFRAGSERGRIIVGAGSALAAGKLLVARRDLPDPNFARTVVLLLSYGDEGAVGIVVNRPSEVRVSSLAKSIAGLAARQEPIYVGGPVPGESLILLIRANEAPPNATPVFEDVWVTQSADTLRKLAEGGFNLADIRLYAGYAGWAPGQLDYEVSRGDWHVAAADVEAIFTDAPGRLWDERIPPLPTQQARANSLGGAQIVIR